MIERKALLRIHQLLSAHMERVRNVVSDDHRSVLVDKALLEIWELLEPEAPPGRVNLTPGEGEFKGVIVDEEFIGFEKKKQESKDAVEKGEYAKAVECFNYVNEGKSWKCWRTGEGRPVEVTGAEWTGIEEVICVACSECNDLVDMSCPTPSVQAEAVLKVLGLRREEETDGLAGQGKATNNATASD